MASKLKRIKPSYIEGGEVWHTVDRLPLIGHTILVEMQLKGSDFKVYRSQDVCIERDDLFVPTMSFVFIRWAYAIDLAQCKALKG